MKALSTAAENASMTTTTTATRGGRTDRETTSTDKYTNKIWLKNLFNFILLAKVKDSQSRNQNQDKRLAFRDPRKCF